MQYSIVIDTSVIVDALTDLTTLGDKARSFLREKSIQQNALLIAPPLFLSEVESTLNVWGLHEKASRAELQTVREALDVMNIKIVHHQEAHLKARDIADSLRLFRVYDATFAALASLRNVEYFTADKTFYNAARRTYDFVKLIA